MIKKITYEDKEHLINDSTIPDKNKVLDTDLNEIKQVVNNNADELDTAKKDIQNLDNDIANIQEEQTEQSTSIEALQTENTELKADNKNLRNSLPEVIGSGSNIILQGTSKNKYKVPPLPVGNSTQVQYSGKNLLEPKFQTRTSNGVTCTYTEKGWLANGSVISGEASYFDIFEKELSAGIYVINGFPNNSGLTYQGVLYKNDTRLSYIKKEQVIINLTEPATIKIQLFYYAAYGTFNNLLLPYQLEEGSTATPYEPYCGRNTKS